MTMSVAENMIDNAIATDLLFGPDAVCKTLFEPFAKEGMKVPKLIIISGENASGKSLLVKLFKESAAVIGKEHIGGIEFMDFGMHRRSRGGIERGIMYGDEDWEATGQISVKNVMGSIRTCRSRENRHIISFDEPEIGLSEGYAAAMGDYLAAFCADLPEKTEAIVVITHSRIIASKLMPLNPICVRVGSLQPTADWIKYGDTPKTIEDLENLPKVAVERLREIKRIIDTANDLDKAVRRSSKA